MEEFEKESLEEDLESAEEKEQALLALLMQKESEIKNTERQHEKNKKEINNIENSKTWRLTKPFQKLLPRSKRKIKEQATYIQELQKDLQETEQALKTTQERLSLEVDQRDNNNIYRMLREAKSSGDIMRFLEYMIQVKHENKAHFNNAFKYIANLYKNERPDYRNMVYSKILSDMKPDDIPEVIMRAGLGNSPLDLGQASSFRENITLRARQNQLIGTLPEWLLDDKEASYAFMDKLQVRRPQTSSKSYSMTAIQAQEGVVIKPLNGAGSRGVYLVHGFHDIIDVKRSKTLYNWDQLKSNMTKDIESGWVDDDAWFIEELIYEDKTINKPARDIKCYCFYGRVALILEIIRSSELKYCWWTETGQRIRTGKYDEDLFQGNGITIHELEVASTISADIPAPFVRIDFLKGEDGLVFGEFTPKPGNYDEFDSRTDQWLGDLFLDAETRLFEDLLSGKQFHTYQKWLSEWNTKSK